MRRTAGTYLARRSGKTQWAFDARERCCALKMLRVKDAGCSSAIVLQGSRESLQFYPTGELATDTLRPDKPGSSLLTSVWGSDTLRRALGLGPWGVR